MVIWLIVGFLAASFIFIMWSGKNRRHIAAARTWLVEKMVQVKNWVVSKIKRK